ncbi:MAG: MFS transporter, partial [Candidatus Woesearchaeota archaeon]
LFQFFSLKLMDLFKSRKKLVVTSAIIQALIWIPMLLTFFMGKLKVYYLIFFAVIYFVSGMIGIPAWNSWIGDIVDVKIRGKYFAKRNRIVGLFVLISIIIAGIILDIFRNGARTQFYGFVIIFIIAMLARFGSAFFLNKKFEPEMAKQTKKTRFSFIQFLKKARFRNYGMFVIFLTLMNFSVFVAAPFFVPYWLYDLKINYIAFMILLAISFIAKYLALPVWGKLMDEHGTKKIVTLTGYIMPILPILWLFSRNYYFFIFIQIIGGIIWAGFELSTFNFIFDTTTPEKRARCVSYFNVINGVMIFLGATIGSLVVKYNNVFWTKYYLVFLISGICRLGVSVYFLPKLKEVRKVADIEYKKLFMKATDMIISESFHNFTFLLHYPRKFKRVWYKK